jgi:hypothetical protein
MLFDVDIHYVKDQLFFGLSKPFPEPWSHLPKVPDMNVVCHWAWDRRTALVPFEYNPQCTPHEDCPPVPVYPTRSDIYGKTPDWAFITQMSFGPGLIEGITEDEAGHMCAWDGSIIYDPRGYCYSRNVAKERFGYQITRFWLAVKGTTL